MKSVMGKIVLVFLLIFLFVMEAPLFSIATAGWCNGTKCEPVGPPLPGAKTCTVDSECGGGSSGTNIFGKIENPFKGKGPLGTSLTDASPTNPFGLIFLFNNLLRLIFVIGGLFAFIQIVLAGFQFISAGGDPKAIESAWGKIWQSIVGLLIMVLSFGLAALFGILLYGDALAILNPKLYGLTP